MSQSAIQQVWPAETIELSAEQKALAALRAEIDSLDDQILELFERRLAVAAQVGKAKDAPTGPHTKLRPDREQAVQARLLKQCDPENREAVEHLWREIVGWGLARQGRLQVQVWAPIDPAKAVEYATRAAQRATAMLAHEEAVRHYRSAIEALPAAADHDAQRCRLLLALGQAQNSAADATGALPAFTRAAGLARRLGGARPDGRR